MKLPLAYSWKNLGARPATSAMTIASIALVVLVHDGVLSFAAGARAAFEATGDRRNVLVLRPGAKSEAESNFAHDRYRDLTTVEGVARDQAGTPIVSGEIVVIQIGQRADGSEANVSLRGVGDAAFALRPAVRIVEGRRFEPGRGELVVGKRLADRYPALRLGAEPRFGRLRFRVVGIFEAGGGSEESEGWGAFEEFQQAFERQSLVSSVRLRADAAIGPEELVRRIEGDQRLNLQALPESEYYEQQTRATSAQFLFLANALAVMMGVGACFAAANTMYAQVASRRREIASLRAIGFGAGSIFTALTLEAAFLGLVAAGVGTLLALPFNLLTVGTSNFITFSEVGFEMRTSLDVVLSGVAVAMLTAVIGGMPAARSATRGRLPDLLRA